jgi:DNA-binding IclR family transcriptional regulator
VTDAALDALLAALGGRATGLWRLGPGGLRLAAFRAAADMPPEVRDGFADATRLVPLDRPDLSIVRAAVEGRPVVARAAEWDAAAGSGYWLRAFGAERSVAVPLRDLDGRVVAVLSIALPPGRPEADDAVADHVRRAAGEP